MKVTMEIQYRCEKKFTGRVACYRLKQTIKRHGNFFVDDLSKEKWAQINFDWSRRDACSHNPRNAKFL